MSNFTRRHMIKASLLSLAAPTIIKPSFAQGAFPARPITIVVPFAAGGSTDIVARLVAQKMSESMGQQVLVENRAGAGGNLGAQAVARSTPDGYTVLMGTISTHTLNPIMAKRKPYDPIADFEPISLLAVVPNVMVVNPKFPVKDVKELIALLKAEPGKHSYASSGNGTPLHLSGELFKRLAKVDMAHIPYRGAGPALNDVVAGQVPIMFDNLPSSAEFIRTGALRALAITTKERAPSFPDLPTMIEAGLPGYETYTWNALFAPAKTPTDVIARLNVEANKAIKDPVVAGRMREFSAKVVASSATELGAHVKAEIALWTPIIQDAGIFLE